MIWSDKHFADEDSVEIISTRIPTNRLLIIPRSLKLSLKQMTEFLHVLNGFKNLHTKEKQFTRQWAMLCC